MQCTGEGLTCTILCTGRGFGSNLTYFCFKSDTEININFYSFFKLTAENYALLNLLIFLNDLYSPYLAISKNFTLGYMT
jgi:hypothetical protein